MKKYISYFFALVLIGTFGCVDQEFDIPPGREVQTEDISTTTIAELKSNFTIGSSNAYLIPEGEIFKGVVVSNDSEGNFFKTLVIQDGGAGIHIIVNAFDLNINYPPGRTVYVKGGLALGEYNGLPQIGFPGSGSEVERIPEALVGDFLIIGELVDVPEATVRTINQLGPNDYSTLIRLENVEFANSLLGDTYAIPNGGGTQNRTVQDCNGNDIVFRNSDFAGFAGDPIPEGNGTVEGVYSVFGSTNQFTISDTNAVDFSGTRCDGGGGGPTGDQVSIQAVRDAFANGATTAPDGFVQGIVISDVESGNLVDQNLVLQDGEFGIVVRFTQSHAFELGAELKINTTGVELSEFNGLLQLNNVSLNGTSFVGSGNSVSPKVLSISQILDDYENLESTLVQIPMATIESGTFNFGKEVSDGTGTIDMFTRSQANFSGDVVPDGEVTITAIVSEFSSSGFSPQIVLRNRMDVEGGSTGTGGGVTIPYSENFESGLPSGWTTYNTVGDESWRVADFNDVYYATNDAFDGGGNPILDMVSWLITPEIDFDMQTGEMLEMKIADAFQNGDPLNAYYSTDYSGTGNPEDANWTEIASAEIASLINNAGSYDNVYESTGQIDLSGIVGKGYIALVYDSNGGTISSTVQISDFIIQ